MSKIQISLLVFIFLSSSMGCVLSSEELSAQNALDKEQPSSEEIINRRLRGSSLKKILKERSQHKSEVEERQKEALSDLTITAPSETETACSDLASECVVIDQGCCLHEKRIAVNQKSAKDLEKKRNAACQELFENKILEENTRLKLNSKLTKENISKQQLAEMQSKICGRRIKIGQDREERVVCKKEVEKPVYKFNPQDEAKYKDELKKYQDAPGKCTLTLASKEIEDALKNCKLSGTVASFEITCNKVISYFQTGNASSARELRIEKDGKSIVIERKDRTSLKGSSSGYEKLYIIVVHPDETSSDLPIS